METIQEKYARLRPQITNGCIINVKGHSLLTRIIAWATGYYTHSLVAVQEGDRIKIKQPMLAVQSVADGVCPAFLSTEIFANDDFCIMRPKADQAHIDDCVDAYLAKTEKGVPYNFWELPKLLLKIKLRINIKNVQGNPNDAICSVSAGYIFGGLIPIKCYVDAYNKNGYLTPQNLRDIAKANPDQLETIGDDSATINP